MKLKEARSAAIKYCEENNCRHTYISYNDLEEFYLTTEEAQDTVFFVRKNGSLSACRRTRYAAEFHKELKKRKKVKRNTYKQKMAEIANSEMADENEE